MTKAAKDGWRIEGGGELFKKESNSQNPKNIQNVLKHVEGNVSGD